MEQYLREREKQAKLSGVTGVALTMVMHGALLICCFLTGFTYLDPPPPEQEQILIEFDEVEIQKPKQTWDGTSPRAAEPDPAKDINLVQKSDAPVEGTKANEAQESVVDDFGDVEVEQPKREKEINKRALFSAANNKTDKDTLAAQTAREVSDALKAGHASGNTKSGETSGEPNARVAGRSVDGIIMKPAYPIQKEGYVIVKIWVDNYGTVRKAVVDDGSTITDNRLWQEARKAALETHFNMSAEAPVMQEGTITYHFKLK